MTSHPQRRAAAAASDPEAAAKGHEALREGRFKEAMDIFRHLVRAEPRPEWRGALTQAYAGRAKALAAKDMFKEAAVVLENTIEPDGGMAEPLLYLRCLIRGGQAAKAAQAAAEMVGRGLPADPVLRAKVEEVAAALALVHAGAFAASGGKSASRGPEAGRWAEMVAGAKAALEAWTTGADAATVDALSSKIALRSPFGPLRAILKSLMQLAEDPVRARKLLSGIATDSVFFPLRTTIETLLSSDDLPLIAAGSGLSPAGRALAVEMLGVSGPALQNLMRLVDAEQAGPAQLFAFLQKTRDLPRPEARAACLALLPRIPDRIHLFDKNFTPLTGFERARVMALAAEVRNDMAAAEQAWLKAVAMLEAEAADKPGEPVEAQARRRIDRARGVIYRHLSELAARYEDMIGASLEVEDPRLNYLQKSVLADPDRRVTTWELIELYRELEMQKEWGNAAQAAAARFPKDAPILQQAMQACAERSAYKLAVGFGRRILALDPINPQARRSLIELGLAQARKQMRAKRPDLAEKQLLEAAEWERPDRPSAELRIARGLVAIARDETPAGTALVRDGVALAGDGVPAWLRAGIEATMMQLKGQDVAFLGKELTRVRGGPASKEDVFAVTRLLGGAEFRDLPKTVLKGIDGLVRTLQPWLLKAASAEWSHDEFHALADLFRRLKAWDLFGEYLSRASRRAPRDPVFEFYRVVLRTKGDRAKLGDRDEGELFGLMDFARLRNDHRFAARIERFLRGEDGSPRRKRKRETRDGGVLAAAEEQKAFDLMMDTVFSDLDEPGQIYLERLARKRGRKAAVDDLMRRFDRVGLLDGSDRNHARMIFEMMIDALLGQSA